MFLLSHHFGYVFRQIIQNNCCIDGEMYIYLTDGDCVLLQYFAASSGNSLPSLRDNLWVRILKTGPIGCPETSARNYHYYLRNNPEEHSSHLLRGGSQKSRMFLIDLRQM
jgi:hypothetical protein